MRSLYEELISKGRGQRREASAEMPSACTSKPQTGVAASGLAFAWIPRSDTGRVSLAKGLLLKAALQNGVCVASRNCVHPSPCMEPVCCDLISSA